MMVPSRMLSSRNEAAKASAWGHGRGRGPSATTRRGRGAIREGRHARRGDKAGAGLVFLREPRHVFRADAPGQARLMSHRDGLRISGQSAALPAPATRRPRSWNFRSPWFGGAVYAAVFCLSAVFVGVPMTRDQVFVWLLLGMLALS